MGDIVLIHDLLDIKARKVKELEYYNEQMNELKIKMLYIQQEINLTSRIINMIEREMIIDIGLHIKKNT